MKVMFYVGTYTDASKQGIHIFEADTDTGAFHPTGLVSGIENPTYLVPAKNRPLLYAAQGMSEFGAPAQNGAVAAYAVKGDTLVPLNHKPVGVTVPCHVALDPSERALVFAEYTNAVAGVFELNADGSLADTPPATVRHTGSGQDKSRQEKAHAHCAEVTPDGKFLCIADLGADRVKAYGFVNRAGGLKEVEALTIATAGGAGPRHLVFHPNKKFVFLLHELDNTVSSYRYTGDAFIHVQTLGTLPPGFRGFSSAAAVKLSADGQRLVTSNRGHDSLATFAVDAGTGRMERLAVSRLAGEFPRDFAFMPGGTFLLVGHEKSNTLFSYVFDAASGSLEPVHGPYAVHRPVCVKFGTPR